MRRIIPLLFVLLLMIPILAQETSTTVETRTSDGQIAIFDISLSISIDPEQEADVIATWGEDYVEWYIIPTLDFVMRDTVAQVTISELVDGSRSDIQTLIREQLSIEFESEGFVVETLTIQDITFSEQFMAALEARRQAEIDIVRARIEAAVARLISQILMLLF